MLDDHQKALLQDIVKKRIDQNEYKVFIFGSRAEGTGRKFSDVDLGIYGSKEVPLGVLATLKEDLDDSTFPFTVDVVDFSRVTADFKKIALQSIIPLYE